MKAIDVATCKVKKWQPQAHAAAINALLPVADGLMASGDDEGCVKLWDPRQASEASACFSEHTDFIADFAYQVSSSPSRASARSCVDKVTIYSTPKHTQDCILLMRRKGTDAWWQQAGMAPSALQISVK